MKFKEAKDDTYSAEEVVAGAIGTYCKVIHDNIDTVDKDNIMIRLESVQHISKAVTTCSDMMKLIDILARCLKSITDLHICVCDFDNLVKALLTKPCSPKREKGNWKRRRKLKKNQ